jgi:hypothetical protein
VRPGPGVPAARQALACCRPSPGSPARCRRPPWPATSACRDRRRTTCWRELIAAGFVVHLPEERRYGLGVTAFEIGSAYLRQEPLARLARPVLARLVDASHW